MANTGSQAQAIRDLLLERLAIYDSTLDLSEGGRVWTQVVEPIFTSLGVDPFDVDIELFLKTRLRQEYPTLPAEDGDAVVDILIRPLQLLLEVLKREIQIVRRGQSTRDVSTLRLEDAQALAANWFVAADAGGRASTTVRAYYSNPTYVSVTSSVVFTTKTGLKYFPTTPQVFAADVVLLQKLGSYYYVDISIIAEKAGSEYNVGAGEITRVTGLTGAAKVTNLASVVTPGRDAETGAELIARTQQSLVERTLNVRRGIQARLRSLYPTIRNLEVVGFGDPEMQRDILEGAGDGHVKAAGTCFIVGPFCLMFSQYEDRGEGDERIRVGDTINLNYWDLLYDLPPDESHEEFAVEQILLDGRDILPKLPGILLFRMSASASPAKAILGLLPGMLPAVFCVVKGKGQITVSGMPGGILEPTTARGELIVESGVVHMGGHYDVWVRPTADVALTIDTGTLNSASSVTEGTNLSTFGVDEFPNKIESAYTVYYRGHTGTAFAVGQTITGVDSSSTGTVTAVTGTSTTGTLVLSDVETSFSEGESIGNGVGGTATIDRIDPTLSLAGVEAGMALSILAGNDVGVYRILKVDTIYAWLDTDLTQSETNLRYRILSEVTVDAFTPKNVLIPFSAAKGDDLRTYVGSARVRVGIDLLVYGVAVGDTFEVLSGEDRGAYTILSFDPILGSRAPVLSTAMSATNSQVSYSIYRGSTGLSLPLVRVLPGGVHLLDPSGQDSGYIVPYALPVGGFARDAFSGAEFLAAGKNGFVLPDPGANWKPDANVIASRDDFADATTCFSDECLPCEGYIACVTLMADGTFWVNSAIPTPGAEFFANFKSWVLGVVNTFDLGEDAKAFVHGLSPFALGAPVEGLEFEAPTGTFIVGETVTGTGGTPPTATITSTYYELTLNTFVYPAGITAFTDGETITQATTLATATIVVMSPTVIRLSAITGSFDPALLITGGTSGVTANVVSIAGQITLTGVSGTFTDGMLLTGGTSLAEGTVTLVIIPVLQFEICIPSEVFDGCNNVFVALPEFDWEATMAQAGSLADAVALYTTGQLNGEVPALSLAAAGDSLTLGAGANTGSYIIHRVHNYRLCTVGAIVEGTADLSLCYPITAVVIDGQFPVAPIGGLADFFSTGIPDLTSLPTPPAFPGTSYDTSGVSQSPWEWVKLFLDWLLKLLVSLGFDLPSSVTIDTQSLLQSLWQLLFTEYSVGRTTCEQVTRVYFVEPTSFTAYGPQPCVEYEWAGAIRTTVALTGETFTLPLAFLDGLEARVGAAGVSGGTDMSATLAGVGAIATIEALAAALQTHLDPDEEKVVFSGPAVATGALTVTTVEAGIDVVLTLWAEDMTDAFRFLGFHDNTVAQVTSTGAAPTSLTTYLSPLATDGFDLNLTFLDATNTVVPVLIGVGSDISFIEMEAIMKAAIEAAVDAMWPVPGGTEATVTFAYSGAFWQYTITLVANNNGSNLDFWQIDAPGAGTNYTPELFGGVVPASGTTTIVAVGSPAPFVLQGLLASASGTSVAGTLTYPQAVAIDVAGAVDFDELAAVLNATAPAVLNVGLTERVLQYVGGATLIVRGVEGAGAMVLSGTGFPSLGYAVFGAIPTLVPVFTDEGTTTPNTTQTSLFDPHEMTLFATPLGTQSLLFCASGDRTPMQVFPGQQSGGDVAVHDLPRDILIASPYVDMLSQIVSFTDNTYGSPFSNALTAGSDYLWLYEQKPQLDNQLDSWVPNRVKDRVPAVLTSAGSATLKLPSLAAPDFTFLSSNVSSDDTVAVGDLLFIEEGDDAGGYTITLRLSATEVVVDRPMTSSNGLVYRYNNNGEIAGGAAEIELTVTSGQIVDTDVGKYLTVWGCSHSDYDGSYLITAIDLSSPATPVLTLDRPVFPDEEFDVHWALVRAPSEAPGDSGTEGHTELVGLRPFRIYKGEPSTWRVAYVQPVLTRTESLVFVVASEDLSPSQGVKQPYQFVRPGVQRTSSTHMVSNQERGLYYADVWAKSLTSSDLCNIPKDVRMEPVFGTYDSDGWRMEVADSRYTFSAYEDTQIILSPFFLPVGQDDRLDAMIALESRQLRIEHSCAPLVAQIQSFLTSEADRVLCANPMARHFLPSYVYFDLNYVGGNSSATIADALAASIEGLEPTDYLDVSKLEKVLHSQGVARYDHPVSVLVVTHDLDRRLVLTKSDNAIGADTIDFNGSNRTTFFIPGPDVSGEVVSGRVGERTNLTRVTTASTLR